MNYVIEGTGALVNEKGEVTQTFWQNSGKTKSVANLNDCKSLKKLNV